MRATLMYGAGDVRVETVPDAKLQLPTDALVRIVRACVCGSDLHPYHSMEASEHGSPMGHEFIGVVEEIGSEVASIKQGDFVIAPFAFSDGTCEFCQEGLQTSCRHGGFWANGDIGGAQAEAIRVPLADGTLVTTPGGDDEAMFASLLTLSDVYPTGHHCAVSANVNAHTTVTVIGDGAVGLSAVLAAKRLGAERIILMGRHQVRTDLGREFGATDVVVERGEEGIEKVRELTDGDGTHTVLEAVGHRDAYEMAIGVIRPGVSSVASASRSTKRPASASTACSEETSPSPVDPRLFGPTSRNSSPTSSTAPSNPARCSTSRSHSRTHPTAIGRWTTAPRSRPWSNRERPGERPRHQRRSSQEPRRVVPPSRLDARRHRPRAHRVLRQLRVR